MKYLKPFIFFVMCSTSILAQSDKKNEFLKSYKRYTGDTIVRIYQNAIIKEHSYVNGREYKPYHYAHRSNPYLKSNDGVGTIYMDGVSFAEKVLRYDIFQDRLVLIPLEIELTGALIDLDKSKIDSFDITIDNEFFRLVNVRLDKDNPMQELENGFYEIPYSGKYRLLIKHKVTLRKEEGLDRYVYQQVFYLYTGAKYYQIKFKREFLALFPQAKKQLKKKCKSIEIAYKKMSVEQKIELVKYAESL